MSEFSSKHVAYTLASQGCSDTTIRQAIGLTLREWNELAARDDEFMRQVESGRAEGVRRVTDRLFQIASEGTSIEAIKYYLSLQSKDYRTEKPQVEITNNTVNLPSRAEIRQILKADPAMDHSYIEGEIDGEDEGTDQRDVADDAR